MIESWRHQRAVKAMWKRGKWLHDHGNDGSEYGLGGLYPIYRDNEFANQAALDFLGVSTDCLPDQVPHVGKIRIRPAEIETLRIPYAIEVFGMPGAGKTTALERYMRELKDNGDRRSIYIIYERDRILKEKYDELRTDDPFLYSLMFATANLAAYSKVLSLRAEFVICDRSQIDRAVWRRMNFERGLVPPKVMVDEEFEARMEFMPMQVGAAIMFLVDPKTSMTRRGNTKKPGAYVNETVLPMLYEQYLRRHYDMVQGKRDARIYECIDATGSAEDVYQRFKYVMDMALSIHANYLIALSRTFPKEYKTAMEQGGSAGETDVQKVERIMGKRMGGKKVMLVGDDDMDPFEMLGRTALSGVSRHQLNKIGEAGLYKIMSLEEAVRGFGSNSASAHEGVS